MKRIILNQLIVTIAITLLFTFNSGTAQIRNIDMDSIAYNNVVKMAAGALNDSSISIALCKIPESPWFREMAPPRRDSAGRIFISPADPNIIKTQVIDILRGGNNIDSLFYLFRTWLNREGYENHFPLVTFNPGSEFILLLDSPFRNDYYRHDFLMEKYEKLIDKAFLNSNNFFFPYYTDAGALCLYCPEEAKYPPQFIYSKELVDDFKTIIKLQENPSLLSESDDSYDTYYSSMKDDLGKRVFSRLFDNPHQE